MNDRCSYTEFVLDFDANVHQSDHLASISQCAESPSPTGPFVYHGHVNMSTGQAGDFDVFVDPTDGVGYVACFVPELTIADCRATP